MCDISLKNCLLCKKFRQRSTLCRKPGAHARMNLLLCYEHGGLGETSTLYEMGHWWLMCLDVLVSCNQTECSFEIPPRQEIAVIALITEPCMSSFQNVTMPSKHGIFHDFKSNLFHTKYKFNFGFIRRFLIFSHYRKFFDVTLRGRNWWKQLGP